MQLHVALVLAASLVQCMPGEPTTPPPYQAHPPRKWHALDRPVTVVVDQTMPEACLDAVAEGLAFWAARVDYLKPLLAGPEDRAVLGVPERGEVGVTASKLTPGVGGLTVWTHALRDPAPHRLHSAVSVLALCNPLVAAHELGHALGLDDTGERGTVMHWHVEGQGWHVTERELQMIR